ncbi:MAG: 3D domain-containing protein [Negativicutes bacterium]|jgi:3D (Asp-Asp-Asp) domain-containing protein
MVRSFFITMALLLLYASVGLAATTISVTGASDSIGAPDSVSQERHLEQGMRGDAVLMLQKYLALTGNYTGDIDGIFGNETRQAVVVVQKSLGEQQSGIATPLVMESLRKSAALVSRGMRTMEMNVSAYSTEDPGCGLYTYRGTRIKKGLCAVDPKVIPLGTRLYVPGYGIAVADDIGSAIKGAKLDLAFESRSAALNFGRKQLTVFILE